LDFLFDGDAPNFASMSYFEKPAPVSRRRFWLWLFGGAVVIALLWPLDGAVDAALDVTSNPKLQPLASWCSKIGEGWVVAAGSISIAVLFLVLHRPQLAARIFFVGMVSLLAGLVADIFRVIFGRTRPLAHAPQGFYGFWENGHWIAGKFEFSSFPSGHAATAAGLAAAAWLVHRGWGTFATIYALAVMWSRVALQCHHLSDVLASTLLGITMAVLLKPVLLTSVEFQFGNVYRTINRK
jgi:membrane-associated phospholipid phosphatase